MACSVLLTEVRWRPHLRAGWRCSEQPARAAWTVRAGMTGGGCWAQSPCAQQFSASGRGTPAAAAGPPPSLHPPCMVEGRKRMHTLPTMWGPRFVAPSLNAIDKASVHPAAHAAQKDEFLRLVINSVRNDLISRNEAFQCLALDFVANGAPPSTPSAAWGRAGGAGERRGRSASVVGLAGQRLQAC